MKKLLYVAALSLALAACGDKTEPLQPIANSITEYEKSILGSKFQEYDEDTYNSTVNENIFYFADKNEDGEIIKVNAAAKTTSFESDKEMIKLTFEALVRSADESLSDTQIDKLFEDLNITWDNEMLDATGVKTLGDYKYTYKGSNEDSSVVLQIEPK